MEIQWFGQSCFRLGCAGRNILIDPFLTGNPTCPPDADALIGKVDTILITHGHRDHVGDTVRLVRRHGARVVAIVELCHWLRTQGVDTCLAMSIGGVVDLGDGISAAMVPAVHSACMVDEDGLPIYVGACAGFVVKAEGWSVYHAGDTDIFSDMALIQRLHAPSIGLIPIGGHYTMTAESAALACNEFLDLDIVIPMHYATFPALARDPDDFVSRLKRGRAEPLAPGGALVLDPK